MIKKKFSITETLVSVIGLILALKVFIYILEHFVLQTLGTNDLIIDQSFLNIPLIILVVLLVIRIVFILAISNRKGQKTSSIHSQIKDQSTCATCGKRVSEKVKSYCLERPQKFKNNVFCFDHQ